MGVFSACSKLVLVLAIAGGCAFYVTPDILKGVSSDMTLQQWQIHAALVGFCLSPVPDMLSKKNRVEDMERDSKIDDAGQGFEYERTEERMDGKTTGGEFDFEKDGDIGAQLANHRAHTKHATVFPQNAIPPHSPPRPPALAAGQLTALRCCRCCCHCRRAENDDYNKASIYSILYGLYANAGQVTCGTPCYGKTADGKPCGQAPCEGVDYQFTFNTWGIAPSPYPPEDPQRHGKAAYAGLVNFPEVKEYMKKNGDAPKIVEIGCGTGAGANLITREIIPNAHYVAIDMQKAAIDTCARTTQPALPQRLLPLALRRALLPAASPVAARLG
jgi:hypothetical protein